MKKIKCIDNKNNNWLTIGKIYKIVNGQVNDVFMIIDDEHDTIVQKYLDGLHGLFEVVK